MTTDIQIALGIIDAEIRTLRTILKDGGDDSIRREALLLQRVMDKIVLAIASEPSAFAVGDRVFNRESLEIATVIDINSRFGEKYIQVRRDGLDKDDFGWFVEDTSHYEQPVAKAATKLTAAQRIALEVIRDNCVVTWQEHGSWDAYVFEKEVNPHPISTLKKAHRIGKVNSVSLENLNNIGGLIVIGRTEGTDRRRAVTITDLGRQTLAQHD